MKEFIYSEMMVHVPMCTNKTPKNILIISNNASPLENELKKYTDIDVKSVDTSLDAIRNIEDLVYDVVICERYDENALIAHIGRVLKNDGQLSILNPSLDDIDLNKNLMHILGNYFKVIMPYNIGNAKTAILASKEYHPTADINLHRADMLDGNQFYNCDIHIASFAMGNYIRKEYLGSIKN